MSIFEPIVEEDQTDVDEWMNEVNAGMKEIVREKSSKYCYDFLDDVEMPQQNGRYRWEKSPMNMKAKTRTKRSIGSSRSSISTIASLEDELSEDIFKVQSLNLHFSRMNSDRDALSYDI